MVKLSNKHETPLYKVAFWILLVFALYLSVQLISGLISVRDGFLLLGTCVFFLSCVHIIWKRRLLEVRLLQDGVQINYSAASQKVFIDFSEIQEATVGDLTWRVAIRLKNGKAVNLGSAIQKIEGSFSVELTSSMFHAGAGDRQLLVAEINRRISD
ncbi:MAG: hypothetical protein EOP04_20485 [Proteobacteria bacterium]|nr:MAG: hypothetical protein EOP04_20485 [Pseudomonadota bacterium]